jgi:hypothetical protein
MEAVSTFETSVNYHKTTWPNIPEDSRSSPLCNCLFTFHSRQNREAVEGQAWAREFFGTDHEECRRQRPPVACLRPTTAVAEAVVADVITHVNNHWFIPNYFLSLCTEFVLSFVMMVDNEAVNP